MQRAGKAAKQAQAVREAEITAQESLELTKALLRVAVHHVSYLRGIFPESNYRKVEMKNLDNIEVYMLQPQCAEAARLQDWVQGGVGDALERRYLHKVFFGFSRDREGKDLLEEYVFTFSYDDNGEVHMAACGRAPRSKKFSTKEAAAAARAKGPTLPQVKYQVCRLMRMLVEVTNTLEEVPENRFLFMKLTYTDDTPQEYEPPMFGPAPDGGVACFARQPFVMEVGKVSGLNIQCGLAVKSLLDTVDGWGEGGDLPVADDNSLFFQDTTARASHSGQDSGTHDASMGGGFSCAGVSKRTPIKCRSEVTGDQPVKAGSPGEAEAPEPAPPASTTDSEHHQQQVGEVMAWVLGRPMEEVHVLDALARFSHIPSTDIDACFATLQRRGVLVTTGEADSYRVVKPAAAAAGTELAAQPADAAAAVQPTEPAAAAAMLEAAEAMGRLQVRMHSQQGGMFEAPGSQATVSLAGKRSRMETQEEGPVEVRSQQLLFPDTQEQSQNGVKRARKASMVDDPIQQGRATRGRAAAAAPAQASAAPVRRSTRHMH